MNKSEDAFPFPTSERHEPPRPQPVRPVEQPLTEDALDHGIEESFPASDPVSVNVTKAAPAPHPATGTQPAPEDPHVHLALRTGLATGTFAGIACSIALAALGHREAKRSMAWVCGSFAAGLLLGCLAGERPSRSRSVNRA